MNYGLYLSAAGTITSLHRQDVMANNLANVNTVGFKPDEISLRARLPERIESQSIVDPHHLLEQLGGGTWAESARINLRQGDLTQTRNDLDLALQGEGFFAVTNGKGGNDHIRFTRDGRFTRGASGELMMASSGMKALDVNNRTIRLNATGAVRIDSAGHVFQNDQPIAQMQIATVADKTALTKEGSNLLRPAATAKPLPATAAVKQGYTESSGVDAILTMNKMINASKAVQANVTMMQYHDHILGQAINTFGRVA